MAPGVAGVAGTAALNKPWQGWQSTSVRYKDIEKGDPLECLSVDFSNNKANFWAGKHFNDCDHKALF